MSKESKKHPSDLDSHHDDPQMEIVEAFSTVFGKLMGYATADWIKLDLSTAQIKVIFTLHYTGDYTINRLAERLNIGAPTASHLVEKLVQAGFVTRTDSTTDRRIVEVHLTDQGHDMARRLSGARNQIIANWVSQLSEDQRTTLGQSLDALLAIINRNAQEQETQQPE